MINFLSTALENINTNINSDTNLLIEAANSTKAKSILFLLKYANNYTYFTEKFDINHIDKNDNTLLHYICDNNTNNIEESLNCIKLIISMVVRNTVKQ